MSHENLDQSLRMAIQERRLVAFILYGEARLVEPHDYGLIGASARLFCYQVSGGSRSGSPHGWRWAPLAEISQFQRHRQAIPRRTPGAFWQAHQVGQVVRQRFVQARRNQ